MLGTLLIAGSGLAILALVAAGILWLTAPPDEDYYSSYLSLMALTNVKRTPPADRMVIGDPPTGDGVESTVALSIPECAEAEGPAAPVGNCRGRSHLRVVKR